MKLLAPASHAPRTTLLTMLTLSATVTLPAAAIALLTSVPDRGFTTSPIGELFLESTDVIFNHEAAETTGTNLTI
ncbi:MAG: Uncharacterised protein [Acidimicrobiales bacterium AG-410-I20]|nr:MAG: Uncharacterised protein [Acidimicrobiales bacterium AG-410-I20]